MKETDMAAELDYRDGKAQMVYAKAHGAVWHNEGFPIEGDEMFAFDEIMDEFFSYPLSKHPYYLPQDPTAPASERVYVQGHGAFYVRRDDTGKVLGSVG